MHSDPSIMRRDIRLAQDMHFVDLDIGLELIVWMAAQGLGSPGSQLAHVLHCPKCCFA